MMSNYISIMLAKCISDCVTTLLNLGRYNRVKTVVPPPISCRQQKVGVGSVYRQIARH